MLCGMLLLGYDDTIPKFSCVSYFLEILCTRKDEMY